MKFSEYIEKNCNHQYIESLIADIDSLLEEYNNIEKEYRILFYFDERDIVAIIKAKSIELAKIHFINTHAKQCIIKSITLK